MALSIDREEVLIEEAPIKEALIEAFKDRGHSVWLGWDLARGNNKTTITTMKVREDPAAMKPAPDFDAMANTLAEAVFQHIEGQRAMVKGELALTLKKELMVLLEDADNSRHAVYPLVEESIPQHMPFIPSEMYAEILNKIHKKEMNKLLGLDVDPGKPMTATEVRERQKRRAT